MSALKPTPVHSRPAKASLRVAAARAAPGTALGSSSGVFELPPRGQWLQLPAGEIVAEEGVQHVCNDNSTVFVTAVYDEAYVVIKRADRTHCYITWLPYSCQWHLLQVDYTWYQTDRVATPLAA